MNIDFLLNLGIEPEQIKAIKQAGIEITVAESKNIVCLLEGPVVIAIKLATNNGIIRDKTFCKQTIIYAIKTNEL